MDAVYQPRRIGPSPSARGSRDGALLREPPGRSIPVCTGEPGRSMALWSGEGVHPRLHGGATMKNEAPVKIKGPSPSARGSLQPRLRALRGRGSIPVCTGEPRRLAGRREHERVHPRLHGGARERVGHQELLYGPSPSARGSQADQHGGLLQGRSIPVCTGEPQDQPAAPRWRRVHPRLHGGADDPFASDSKRKGPSPSARGSPCANAAPLRAEGSIPVCTGEPID